MAFSPSAPNAAAKPCVILDNTALARGGALFGYQRHQLIDPINAILSTPAFHSVIIPSTVYNIELSRRFYDETSKSLQQFETPPAHVLTVRDKLKHAQQLEGSDELHSFLAQPEPTRGRKWAIYRSALGLSKDRQLSQHRDLLLGSDDTEAKHACLIKCQAMKRGLGERDITHTITHSSFGRPVLIVSDDLIAFYNPEKSPYYAKDLENADGFPVHVCTTRHLLASFVKTPERRKLLASKTGIWEDTLANTPLNLLDAQDMHIASAPGHNSDFINLPALFNAHIAPQPVADKQQKTTRFKNAGGHRNAQEDDDRLPHGFAARFGSDYDEDMPPEERMGKYNGRGRGGR